MLQKPKYYISIYISTTKCKLLCILFYNFFLVLPLLGQSVYIDGSIELQDSISDPVYTIVALRTDSSIYKGQVYLDSCFVFEVNCDSTIGIQISSIGYEPIFYSNKEIMIQRDHQRSYLGRIKLKSNLSLNEIVVFAKKKSLNISSTGYSINVKNSHLSTYGTFNDVIKRVPGIIVSPRGGIEVIGKSKPLFILNGKRLLSASDLERLDPRQIKAIHIDQNPGPEYDASYDVVVKVETINYSQEFYSIDLRNRFEYGRRPSNYSRAIIQWKNKTIVYGLEMQYNTPRYKQYDTEDKSAWMRNDTIKTHREAVLSGKDRDILVTPSFQWFIDENNRLEIIYRFNTKNTNYSSDQDYISTVLGTKEFIKTFTIKDETKNIHNPSLFYIYEKNKHQLQLSADYYRMKTSYDQKVEETYIDKLLNNNQEFKDKYEIFGGTADYKTTIGKWQISTGGKISSIRDEGKYQTNDNPLNSSLLKDNTYALYIGTASKISLFFLSAALRAEWNNTNYNNTFYKENVSSDYFNLFPSASIRYTGNKIAVSLAYSKNITRPSFSQLNPNRRYLDPISYMVGNPFLKSKIAHNITLSAQHANLIFRATYAVEKNPQIGILELTSDSLIAYTYSTIPKTKFINFAIIYSLEKSWFRSSLVLQTRFQDIRFEDRIYSKLTDKPRIVGSINLDFDLWKNGSFNIIGFYYGNYIKNIVKMKNSGDLSFELNQSFCNSKWRLSIGIEDVFKTSHPNSWERYLNNSIVKMDTNADSRFFYFTMQYRIGKMKTSKKSSSIISDEKNRL